MGEISNFHSVRRWEPGVEGGGGGAGGGEARSTDHVSMGFTAVV